MAMPFGCHNGINNNKKTNSFEKFSLVQKVTRFVLIFMSRKSETRQHQHQHPAEYGSKMWQGNPKIWVI